MAALNLSFPSAAICNSETAVSLFSCNQLVMGGNSMLHDGLYATAAPFPRVPFMWEAKQQHEQKPHQSQGHLTTAGFPCSTPGSFNSSIIWQCIFLFFSRSQTNSRSLLSIPSTSGTQAVRLANRLMAFCLGVRAPQVHPDWH